MGYVDKSRFSLAVYMVLLWLLFNPPRSVAQTVTGRIVGPIHDAQGAVIPGLSVSAKNLETGAERTAVSDESGGFIVTNIPAGSYEVTASLTGFQKEVRDR